MKESTEKRYNLIFSGQLQPGTDRDAARATLAQFFGLKDPAAVEGFFSGRPVPLRRGLSRSDAQRHYRALRAVGLICDLEEVRLPSPSAEETADSEKEKSSPGARGTRNKKPASQSATPRRTAADSRNRGPNLFALRPTTLSRHLPREREAAQVRALIGAAAALTLGVVVLAVSLRFPAAPAGAMPQGPLAAAALADNGLALLLPGALLLHERSGLPRKRVNAFELGLRSLAPPLWANSDGGVLLNGDAGAGMTLQRCDLEELLCMPLLTEAADVVAIASSYLGDRRFLLTAAGEILLTSPEGRIITRSPVDLPQGHPRLLAGDGLLLLGAGEGPLLGVYRPDENRFAEQLDALLLMPPAALETNRDRIQDVALGDDYRWSLLAAADGSTGLYRFTRQWGDGVEVVLEHQLDMPFLVRWRDKLLVASPMDERMLRFAADGRPEALFESTMLKDLRDEWLERVRQRALLRQGGVLLPLVLAALCVVVALLYFAQHKALSSLTGRPTALLDPMPGGVRWHGPHEQSHVHINRLGLLIMGAAAAPALVLFLSGQQLGTIMLLPAAAGGLLCWMALRAGAGGFIGTVRQHVIAVDHDGQYFYGEQSHLRRRGDWLLAPGVVMPLGLGPVVNIAGPSDEETPMVGAPPCTAVELIGMLWRRQHPWMHGALYLAGGWLLTLLGLLFVGP